MNVVECWELLHDAVVELSTSAASPRQRLLSIANRYLAAAADASGSLADVELRDWLRRLVRRLYGKYNRPSGMAFMTTVNALSDEEVDEILIDVVSLYDELTRVELLRRIGSVAA